MEAAKVTAGVRKEKHVKDELDRIKQAEKKKRRLEKALATSAAIRSELEKKKRKKKEEQERLDEEGAKIAEAVALHVLLDGVAKVTAGVRKAKKKHVKDELDRIKQAEKKKRRLEKALATSAAICSELEKKKQRKKEEQERLDEEGARIAEAVALHVLLGEDSDDSSRNIILKKDEGLTSLDHDIVVGRRRRSLIPFRDLSKYSLENIGWVCDGHGYDDG
ncbi:hypothetical protein OROHE_021944 [Orobanche hederae]